MPNGLSGIWSRLTGKYSKIKRQNEFEAWEAVQRDQAEKNRLIESHLKDRQRLQQSIDRLKEKQMDEVAKLNAEIADHIQSKDQRTLDLEAARTPEQPREQTQQMKHENGLYKNNDKLEPEL